MTDRTDLAATLDELLKPEPWCIDDLRLENGILEISGWALAPGGRHADLHFMINQRKFDQIEYPRARSDVAKVFWYKAGAKESAFRCRTPLSSEDTLERGHATLKCVHRETGRAIREEYNYYYPDGNDLPPLPDPVRRKRVAGNDKEGLFTLEGYSILRKLDLTLRRRTGKDLEDYQDILDWGCGCGRLTRFLVNLPDPRITGVDIDKDTISWCQGALPGGTFLNVPLHPPTELPRAGFDLVLGISVFSHLKEPEQIEWLYELNRVTRPGAVLLLSVLGEAAVCRTPCDSDQLERWCMDGTLAIRDNTDLKGYIEDEDYYVNTYVAPDYIRRSWSRFFVVEEIIPAYIGNLQDLVILRKPA